MSAVMPDAIRQEADSDEEKEMKPMSAAIRLAESRERMRQYMLHGDGRHEARRRNAAARAVGLNPSRLDKLRAMPVVGVVIDALWAWWSNHPLQPAASLAEGLAHETIVPLTRRHPIGVLVGAFCVGGAIAWFRPWRYLGKEAIFAGLVSQVASITLTSMPWESVLGALTSFAHSRSEVEATHTASAEAANSQTAASTAVPEKDEATA